MVKSGLFLWLKKVSKILPKPENESSLFPEYTVAQMLPSMLPKTYCSEL